MNGGSDVLYLLFQGVFCVGVSEGQDLVKKDKHLIGGKSDPYVVLKIGESKVSFKVTSFSSLASRLAQIKLANIWKSFSSFHVMIAADIQCIFHWFRTSLWT